MGSIDSWAGVEAHLRENYIVEAMGPKWLRLAWSFPTEGGEPIFQALEVTVHHDADVTFLRLVAPVAAHDEVGLEHALRRNYQYVATSLSLMGNVVVLRHDLALPLATNQELDRLVKWLPHEAAGLRHRREFAISPEVWEGWAD